MSRALSIRSRLVGIFLVVIVVFGGAVAVTTMIGARRAVRSLSAQLIARQIDNAEERLDRFFQPVRNMLRIGEDWGAQGLLDPDRPEELRRLFQPVLLRSPQVSSVLLADERGREFMLLRLGERWIERVTRRDEWGPRVRWTEWTDREPQPREESRELDYDPRERPWFRGAMERRGAEDAAARLHWTDPYVFYTTKLPGITASATFRSGGHDRVLGIDILLDEISNFTMRMGLLDHATVAVLAGDGRVLGLPPEFANRPPAERERALLKRPEELGVQVLRDAARELPLGAPEAERFESGEAWWGGRRRYALGPGRELEVVVAVPENEILGELASIRDWMAAITALVLALALWRAASLARRFSRPIERIAEESDRISRGDLDPGAPVESPVLEVRRLADAHERMRGSLKKLLHLEGELRVARQIQHDTFPTVLPELAGFDCAGLTLPASETGGDTYDVIGVDAAGTVVTGPATRAVFLVADATGHGIGPALSVTQVRAMLRMAVRTGQGLPEFVRHLNEQLCEDLESGRFVTAWLGDLDTRSGTIQGFSAGQGPLLRFDAASGAWEERKADLPPLGILAHLKVSLPPPVVLRPGDLYLVLSDGFFEAASPTGELFGAERVRRAVEARRSEPSAKILEALVAEVDRHLGGEPAGDDRTAVLIRRL